MYFKEPFAAAGDRATIPSTVQPDGSISYPDGYGVDYQLDPSVPPGLNIGRTTFNELMFQVTTALQQYQQKGFPDFITTGDNGGTPYPYTINSTVRFSDGWAGAGFMNYYSLVDSNTADPTDNTKWGLVSYSVNPFVTGDMQMWAFNTIRTGGWVWLNGTTIGSVASGATGRANADTSALFAMLWTDYSNAVLPIQDSSGNPSTRGANAAADFAANKRLPVPDFRGRSFFGIDNMGGAAAAGRITSAESAISGTTLGAAGGNQSVGLTANQNGTHLHSGVTDPAGIHSHTVYQISADPSGGSGGGRVQSTPGDVDQTSGPAGNHTHTFSTSSSGLGSTHQNMPPAMIGGGFIMKL